MSSNKPMIQLLYCRRGTRRDLKQGIQILYLYSLPEAWPIMSLTACETNARMIFIRLLCLNVWKTGYSCKPCCKQPVSTQNTPLTIFGGILLSGISCAAPTVNAMGVLQSGRTLFIIIKLRPIWTLTESNVPFMNNSFFITSESLNSCKSQTCFTFCFLLTIHLENDSVFVIEPNHQNFKNSLRGKDQIIPDVPLLPNVDQMVHEERVRVTRASTSDQMSMLAKPCDYSACTLHWNWVIGCTSSAH